MAEDGWAVIREGELELDCDLASRPNCRCVPKSMGQHVTRCTHSKARAEMEQVDKQGLWRLDSPTEKTENLGVCGGGFLFLSLIA